MLYVTCCLCVGEVIAEGQDGTKQHPLRHAIMAAIDAAAARDRRLWPMTSSQTQETSAAHAPPLPSHSIASDDNAVKSDLPGAQNVIVCCCLCTVEITFAACTLIVLCTACLQDCQGA